MVNEGMLIGAGHRYCVTSWELKLVVFQAECKVGYLTSV